LVQDATYSTLLRSGRQQLHAHIAATLEQGSRKLSRLSRRCSHIIARKRG